MTPMSNKNRGFVTVCYYRWDEDKLKPGDLDTSLCTHLILGFTEVENSILSKGSTDGDSSYQAVANLKTNNPSLKVMLSVGGGGKSRCFHEMVSDPSNTDRYVDFINLMTYDLHLFKCRKQDLQAVYVPECFLGVALSSEKPLREGKACGYISSPR
ncbi:hypothetical protein HPB52_019745 [Rhipicephalus sanguineus]|uniref:GH18 domain-containing protein n=1 Tax=Rhipicephalus sanguineus TaxID=34632 RepID=A0A9D4YQL1_RHISA|nr:hypothetical protein HPB52_019745 [Rhipicephalus sanguineus]